MNFQIFIFAITCSTFAHALTVFEPLECYKSDLQPHQASDHGIRNIQIKTTTAHHGTFDIIASFDEPRYGKPVAYFYELYHMTGDLFLNTTHYIPYTRVNEGAQEFSIKDLQYNTPYFLKIFPKYKQLEYHNSAYTGSRHFYYTSTAKGLLEFTNTANYVYAPTYKNGTVSKHSNGTYQVQMRWNSVTNKDFKNCIKKFDVTLSRTDNHTVIFSHSFKANDQEFSYTFSPVPPNAEYQVIIQAIPEPESQDVDYGDHRKTRTYFNLI